MPTVRVNDIDIWYERSGGGGPTLVLSHGFAGASSAGWPAAIDEFRSQFDLVLFDARAHAKTGVSTDLSTVTMPRFAADVAGLMDILGIEQAHIGGVSMGGMVSAQFACDYPDRVRSLLLCDTVAGNVATRPTRATGSTAEADDAERFLIDALTRMARVVEKHGTEGLVERENRYRRDGDQYAHLQPLSLDEQDARNALQKVDNMTVAGYLAASRAMRERPDLIAARRRSRRRRSCRAASGMRSIPPRSATTRSSPVRDSSLCGAQRTRRRTTSRSSGSAPCSTSSQT